MRGALPWITAAIVVVLDRVSKTAILANLTPGAWVEVFPGLALTHVHNRGIAFSLFSDGGPISRAVLHLVIFTSVVLIAWMVVRHGHRRPLAGLAFGLILGGAVGNLIDRVLFSWVIDFLHVWVRVGGRTWSWPDFNVADSSITVGAILLIINEFRDHRTKVEHASDSD
ncbi:MAG: signal peptidase II [Thermoanaerobaculales bacterium]